MTITTSATNKSFIAFILSIFLPVIVNIKNPSSAIFGLIGGATAATVANKSLSSRNKEEEFTLPINNEISLISEEKVIDKLPNLKKKDSLSLETQSNSNALIAKLKEKGIEVVTDRQSQEGDEPLDSIARYLGKNYSILEKLQRRIKVSISKNTRFSFNLYGKSQQEIASCTNYCSKLHRASLLSDYYYDRRRKVIRGAVQRRGDIINFLNGGWFERAILDRVKEKFVECKNVEFLVNPHLKFANGDRFELDILFLVDNQLFWIECKTGNHYNDCLPKYCNHREKLGVAKENAFLVGLELSDLDAEKWTKLWTITVVNTEGLLEKI